MLYVWVGDGCCVFCLNCKAWSCIYIGARVWDVLFRRVLNYLFELISRRESYVNTQLADDHHQLIMPPICKGCSNTFLERSFMYADANGTN